jgi:hypothetical protein
MNTNVIPDLILFIAKIDNNTAIFQTCKTFYSIVETAPKFQYLAKPGTTVSLKHGKININIGDGPCLPKVLLTLPFQLNFNAEIEYFNRKEKIVCNPVLHISTEQFFVNGREVKFPAITTYTDYIGDISTKKCNTCNFYQIDNSPSHRYCSAKKCRACTC